MLENYYVHPLKTMYLRVAAQRLWLLTGKAIRG